MAEKKKILYIVEAMGGGVFTYIVDLIDLPSAEEWMNRLYDEWPIHGRTLSTGRTLKKNAGEISLTILAEIFAWYHDGVDSLTIYTQDTDETEQRNAGNRSGSQQSGE